MGLDLILLPLNGRGDLNDSKISSFNRLRFGRDYRIFGQIANKDGGDIRPDCDTKKTVRPHLLPPTVKLVRMDCGEDGIIETRKDGHDVELTYAFVEELKELRLPEGTPLENKAIMAYISALPNDCPVLLYWE